MIWYGGESVRKWRTYYDCDVGEIRQLFGRPISSVRAKILCRYWNSGGFLTAAAAFDRNGTPFAEVNNL